MSCRRESWKQRDPEPGQRRIDDEPEVIGRDAPGDLHRLDTLGTSQLPAIVPATQQDGVMAGQLRDRPRPTSLGEVARGGSILAYNGVLNPTGLPVIAILVGLTLYLAWAYRAAFLPMLRARVAPTAADDVAASTAHTVTT